ncbi:MAG: CDP-alcohol phosphatidyltransferase family protein [Patescibacteria group bacterium]
MRSLNEILENVNSTVANRISASRILMLPFYLIYHYMGEYSISFALAFYMVISDFLDGYVARLYGEISEFGKILDPIADKAVTLTLFVSLLAGSYGLIERSLWRSIIITSLGLLALEAVLIILGHWAAKKNLHNGSNLFGKAKMITESYIFLFGYYFFFLNPGLSPLAEIGRSINDLLYVAVGLAFLSIIGHITEKR